MAPHEYEALSREERLRRIGALFYKAVVISLARKQGIAGETSGDVPAQAGEDSPRAADVLRTALLPEEDLALFQRYAQLGEIAPRDATEFWGVSRTTAYRRLWGLEEGGCPQDIAVTSDLARSGRRSGNWHLSALPVVGANSATSCCSNSGGGPYRVEPFHFAFVGHRGTGLSHNVVRSDPSREQRSRLPVAEWVDDPSIRL